MSERESDTRLHRIDPKLEAAGWAVAQSAQMIPQIADESVARHATDKKLVTVSARRCTQAPAPPDLGRPRGLR